MYWTDQELYLFNQGTYYHSYKRLGAHAAEIDGREGVLFSVWAPFARSVCVVGSFNNWSDNEFFMECLGESGVWELFIPDIEDGELYKYVIHTEDGDTLYKADPYAFSAEVRPGTASKIVLNMDHEWNDSKWMSGRGKTDRFHRPMNIYEVHAGSWKCPFIPDGKTDHMELQSVYNYREIADMLSEYCLDMGYTHIELMPVAEHPFDGSWGYQVTGYYAPTSRYGSPEDFKHLVDTFHQAGIGVIMDWVPGHFCKDAHGLGRLNGRMLYENRDHEQWGTYCFDLGRPEVKSFLLSNAMYWLSEYHIDGIRVDGVSSMLYLNFGIDDPKDKRFNEDGGEENKDAIAFLQQFSEMTGKYFPDVFTIAEESTAWPLVTYPPDKGGLGFHFKWNMGWMNDTLWYFSTDFPYRKDNHSLLTFSMMYAYSENYILPLSHDEVVHGKRSLIGRMPGSYDEQFANLRLLYLLQMGYPGAKMQFMGSEFGQFIEWRFYEPLEWFLLDYDAHRKLKDYVKALNHFYLEKPELWIDNDSWDGFKWIDVDNAGQSILSFMRIDRDKGDFCIIILNLRPVDYPKYDIGVPSSGSYREILSTDSEKFGGSGALNPGNIRAKTKPMHGFDQRITIHLPALTGIIFKPVRNGLLKENDKEKKENDSGKNVI